MKKETESATVISDRKAERVMRAREKVRKLSEVFTGRPMEIEKSFYIKRLGGINAAHEYLEKKMEVKKEQQNSGTALWIAFVFLFGMLFGAIITNLPAIREVVSKL